MIRPILGYLTVVIQTVIAVWASFLWRRSTFSQRCIIVLIAEISISGIIEIWTSLHNIRNLWVIHISTLLEFLIITAMFYGWKKKTWEKCALIVVGCLFVILWLISKNTFEPFNQLDSYTTTIADVFYIVVALSVFFDVLNDHQMVLKDDPRTWASSAILIYSSGSLILFSLFNEMMKVSIDLLRMIGQLNLVLEIFFALLLARAIWCRSPQ